MISISIILILPLVMAALAIATALLANFMFDLSLLQTALVGVSAFCVVLTLVLYLWMVRHVRSVGRKIDTLNSFEDSVLGRLQSVENDAAKTGRQMIRRIERLEEKPPLSASLQDDNHRSAGNRTSEADTVLPSPDGNVVPLNPPGRPAGTQDDGNNSLLKRKRVAATINRALNGSAMSIRLQPILNLIDKEVIGLEAFAFFNLADSFVDGRDFIGRMTVLQRSEYDLKVIHALSAVIREMQRDGQIIPIHYHMLCLTSSADANWLKIMQAFKSDPILVANLVPVISQGDYDSMDQKALENLLELRECGLKPCLGQIAGIEKALEKSTLKHFRQFKVKAETLLKYRSSESERFADQLLPGLAKANAEIFVDGIQEAFQASQLIDLDLVAGQGDYISPPKSIRLYKDIEKAAATIIADKTS